MVPLDSIYFLDAIKETTGIEPPTWREEREKISVTAGTFKLVLQFVVLMSKNNPVLLNSGLFYQV